MWQFKATPQGWWAQAAPLFAKDPVVQSAVRDWVADVGQFPEEPSPDLALLALQKMGRANRTHREIIAKLGGPRSVVSVLFNTPMKDGAAKKPVASTVSPSSLVSVRASLEASVQQPSDLYTTNFPSDIGAEHTVKHYLKANLGSCLMGNSLELVAI